jgi:hypothetical protein
VLRGAVVLKGAAALLAVTAMIVAGPATVASSETTGSVSSTPCPTEVAANQCVSATPAGCTSSCPTATVGPTQGIADDAYVYVSLAGFPTGDWVSINLCPQTPLGSGADPVCAYGPYEGITFDPGDVKILPDGDGLLSYQVTSDPAADGSGGIPGMDVQEQDPTTPFFCDNGADPCALYITDIGQGQYGVKPLVPLDTDQNTIVVPLTFAASSNGCPSSDPIINTEGAFSVEEFVPTAAAATCGGPTGVIDLNTSTDTETAVSDFAQGNTALAFTDDPADPVQLADLKGVPYMFVPVAATAAVVSFLSATSLQLGPDESAASPEASYNLTPNMVAGMITSGYSNTYGIDGLVPPLTCKELGCKASQSGGETTFNLLNPAPSGGFVGPGNLLSSFSSVATGSSDEVTGWLCAMPNVALTIKANGGTFSAVDKNVAAKTLETDATNKQPWPFQSCTDYPTIPTVGTPAGTYQPAQTPANQAAKIRTEWAGGTLGSSPGLYGASSAAGFGAMDWGDAAFFGLGAASLENASGAFVAPSQASIDAALGDAGTVTTAGGPVLSYDYTTNDPAAYPTPLVSYAVLSLAPQTGDQVVDETSLLTNLVNYSHDATGASLPGGYVPLPDNLYSQAMADIQTALTTIVETSPPTPRTSPTTAAAPGTTPAATSSAVRAPSGPGAVTGGEGAPAFDNGVGVLAAHSDLTSLSSGVVAKPTTPGRKHPTVADRGFVPTVVALLAGRDRLILPGLLGVMVVALLAGGLLLAAVYLRRRHLARRNAAGTGGATT